jgi:two-component system osmolarity sensor histidine kinase EnvZ
MSDDRDNALMIRHVFHRLWRRYGRYLFPRGLFGRFSLMVFLPMLLVQIIATYIFFYTHWDSVSQHMARSLAGEVAYIVHHYTDLSLDKRSQWLQEIHKHLYLKGAYKKGSEIGPPPSSIPTTELHQLSNELAIRLPYPFSVVYTSKLTGIEVSVQLPTGVLTIIAPRKRLFTPTNTMFMAWMSGSSILLCGIALVFLRNQVRSIRELANAADVFGKGQTNYVFKPHGATEIRKAGYAFLRMRDRLERYIQQRTELLSAVSHDLRTPLTRLNLQLALLPANDDMHAMQQDVREMEYMIHEYLDFVRGEGTEEWVLMSLSQLAFHLADQVLRQYPNRLLVVIVKDASMWLRPHSLRRALNNLVMNGLRHAHNVHLQIHSLATGARIVIDDDGPGIAESERNRVFKPFVRLDPSRSHNHGEGVGLGMTIAQDIITGHGGSIALDKSPLGGLRVVIFLPY